MNEYLYIIRLFLKSGYPFCTGNIFIPRIRGTAPETSVSLRFCPCSAKIYE